MHCFHLVLDREYWGDPNMLNYSPILCTFGDQIFIIIRCTKGRYGNGRITRDLQNREMRVSEKPPFWVKQRPRLREGVRAKDIYGKGPFIGCEFSVCAYDQVRTYETDVSIMLSSIRRRLYGSPYGTSKIQNMEPSPKRQHRNKQPDNVYSRTNIINIITY